MRNGAYAVMLAFCLAGTLPLDWYYRLGVLRQARRLALAVLPVALLFLAWDVAATAAGHWRFDPGQTLPPRVLGLPLELVADRNPYMMTTGQSLGVRLLYRDQPLAGALVVALNQRDPMARVAARSDKAGHVTLKLAEPGPWLIKAVHMIPAPAGSDSQWASYWASLTFELADAAPRAVTSSSPDAR